MVKRCFTEINKKDERMKDIFTIYSTMDYYVRVDDDCIHDVDLVRELVVVQVQVLDEVQHTV